MTEQPESGRLLDMLHRLFSRVSMMDLEKRKKAYRSQTGAAVDISSKLNQHIERIASQSSSRPRPLVTEKTESPDGGSTRPSLPTGSPVAENSAEEVINYFKDRAVESDPGAYMGNRLVASTWSHIHTAIMHARQGDLAKAKLHADIANQALKESAHYLDDEEYHRFAEDVEQALALLGDQTH